MGIERSAARKKRDNKRAARARRSTPPAGPVTVRRIGDPVPDQPTSEVPLTFSRRVAPLEDSHKDEAV